MNIDIREYIINNFKDSSTNDLEDAINESINERSDEALPGMGVLLELLWLNSNSNEKKMILENIKKAI